MADRAYATFVLTKAVDAEQRVIEGLASTPELDRQGDSMDPAGAQFALPLPLLWQHRADQPIGHVIAADVTDRGIAIRAQIAPKGVLGFIDDAWQLLKAGLVGGLSIDWRPLAPPTLTKGGYRYSTWSWLALSAVTIPANASASIRLIKQLDLSPTGSAASGGSRELVHGPGVPGVGKRTTMNVSEQLATEQAALHTKSLRFEELITEEQAHGVLDADAATEKDTLSVEIGAITKKVHQLKTLEDAQAAQSKSITAITTRPTAMSTTTGQRIEVVAHKPGTVFTRCAMAVAAGKGSYSDSVAYAKRFTDTPEVLRHIKALEGTSVVGSPAWGGELVNPMQTEFVDLVRPRTIVGQIPNFNTVPFNTRIVTQTGSSTFAWVAEGAPKPVGELAFEMTTLTSSKCAGIVVISDELIRFSSPSAEDKVRNDLVAGCAQFIDEQFIHLGVTGGPDHPASVTHGAPATPASGTDYVALQADLWAALAEFDTAHVSTMGLAVVTTPALARGISMLLGPMGMPAFNSVSPSGGTLTGYQLVVSDSVETGVIALLQPKNIFLADDGRVTLDASNQATLDMSGGSTPTFNLWQKNCTGIRAERWIRWQAQTGAVSVITGAAYGPTVPGGLTTTRTGGGRAPHTPPSTGGVTSTRSVAS